MEVFSLILNTVVRAAGGFRKCGKPSTALYRFPCGLEHLELSNHKTSPPSRKTVYFQSSKPHGTLWRAGQGFPHLQEPPEVPPTSK